MNTRMAYMLLSGTTDLTNYFSNTTRQQIRKQPTTFYLGSVACLFSY